MAAKKKATAIRTILDLDLAAYTARAVKLGHLDPADVEAAVAEYRQFLLLVWTNHHLAVKKLIIPTARSDHIWHEHILDTAAYRDFCERLVGRYIDHRPGLEAGTLLYDRALDHTRNIQGAYGEGRFVADYLGCVAGSKRGTHRERVGGGGCSGTAGYGGGGDTGGSSCGGGCGGD